MGNTLCAIIVTYNRKELLFRNIMSVLGQSVDLDILIFDNHSTDGTYDFLVNKGILPAGNIIYHYSDQNLGGAGGFSNGLRMAFEKGYEMFWLMDDDGYCYNTDTLKKLLVHIPTSSKDFILNSTVICDDDRTLTFGFLDITTFDGLLSESRNGEYDGYINPFNGTLISRECVNNIGYPYAEFFLYGDEHEYMLRAKKNGIILRTVVDSLYYHPINRSIEYKHFGKFDIPIKDEPVWKTFCDVRNSIFISRKYESYKMTLVRVFIYICSALYHPTKKWARLKITCIGIADGIRGSFSRPIMFNK